MRRVIARFSIWLLLLTSAVLPSCAGRPAGPDAPGDAQPAAGAIRPAEVDLRMIDEKELAEALVRYRGEVVLVDFWATWCGPCKDLFPHTVGMHRALAGRGLAVITVSLDSPKSEPAVRAFLASQGAITENFQSRFGASDETLQRFEIPGAIPYLRLYDRSGKLRQTFPADQSELRTRDIDQAIERLLAEKG